MRKITLKYVFLIVFIAIAGISVFIFKSGEANTYHLYQAAEILTMQECLACHDGYIGKSVSVCLGDNCLYSKSHSLMHDYPPAGKDKDYSTVFEIEQAGCILENGKVACLSCHDLTKPAPHLILNGDDLCILCHKALRSTPDSSPSRSQRTD